MSARILVAGLGNVLMSDDAIGPHCVRHLAAHYEFPDHVEMADLGTPGLDLAVHLSSADVVLIVDAARDLTPGTIAVFDLSAGTSAPVGLRLDTHAPALDEALLLARLSGSRPTAVRLIALGGVRFDHGTMLSPVVRANLSALVNAVLGQLTALHILATPRTAVCPSAPWWEASRRSGSAGVDDLTMDG